MKGRSLVVNELSFPEFLDSDSKFVDRRRKPGPYSTDSPLLGSARGASLYVDSTRVNEVLGDSVSWDLMPRSSITPTPPEGVIPI